ncbi:MAG: hypothetical protein LBO06_08475, partial [Bacteroidales bacterium]|nr:hypothetical protein [Bacteroidales bacterium]
MKVKLLLLGAACAIIFGFNYNVINAQNVNQSQAWKDKSSIWKEFRKNYSYQFQIVGEKKYDDGSRLLLISEPPPHTKLDSVRKIFGKYISNDTVFQHKIGYDGWVKDIIICTKEIPDNEFLSVLQNLQKYLFHTDYKAYAIPLPIQSSAEHFLAENLNYLVTSDELYSWFLETNTDVEKFVTEQNAQPKSLRQIFNGNNSDGIYFSEKPGFVTWVLHKNSNIDNKKEDARKFALDGDLIFGAINSGDYVAIIAREREVSVLSLPPLRVEMMLLLAKNINKEELGQSFENAYWFLGKQQKNDNKDWFFAWLCDELVNTEYGNLLNQCDYNLKDWTDSNTLKGYYDYSDEPYKYPFSKALHDSLNAQSIVYNWSSEALTYTYEYKSPYSILACLGGTGCLPITYILEWENKVDSVDISP